MPESAIQGKKYAQDAYSYAGGPICVCASQGNEYGYSYYWWYYGIPTSNRHAVGESN